MANSNEELLDQLTCPICLVHPDKEMYQCANGHPICSTCIEPKDVCPQCQVPFGIFKIRCRLMESLLDIVKLPCSNKDGGCRQHFLRKDLPKHQKNCEFRSVSLCKWMGYACDFTASTVAPLLDHLESCHHPLRSSSFTWNNFQTHCCKPPNLVPFSSLFIHQCAGAGDAASSEKIWILFLARQQATLEQTFVSVVPILLQDGRSSVEHSVELAIINKQRNRVLAKWTGFPSHYKDAEEDILCPSFRLTTKYIQTQALKFSQLTKFDLTFSFSVVTNPTPSIQQDVNNNDSV